jgi:hypothetical protein
MPCSSNKVINPITGRCITVGGKVHKALSKTGTTPKKRMSKSPKSPSSKKEMALILIVGQAATFAVVQDSVFTAEDKKHFAEGNMINREMWKRVTAHSSFKRLTPGMGVSLPRPSKMYMVSGFLADY